MTGQWWQHVQSSGVAYFHSCDGAPPHFHCEVRHYWMKICHTVGLDVLSSLTCHSTLGLPGRQTSHLANSFSGGMSRTSSTYYPCQMIFKNWDSASSPLWQP
jgi:hypothetical protein